MENLSGQIIKGYVLQEQIGLGGFGAIYRAHQAVVDREVAIKVILPQYASQPGFIRRFEAEAQLVARLEHPHIVPLYDYWRDPSGAYLVMRWLRGGSLHESLFQHGPWSLEDAARLLDQIASALATAHRNGVIHQDIKPDNILLDEEQNAYLADFGIAINLLAEAQSPGGGERLGTPPFMAPEQINHHAVTPQSDVYSLGVVLYTLLTDRMPFTSTNMAEVVHKILKESLPPLAIMRPDLPDEVESVITLATAKHAHLRYGSPLDLAAAFREAALGQSADNAPAAVARPPFFTAEALEALKTPAFAPWPQFTKNPYKGLRAFHEADAADFFGRSTLIRQLLDRLAGGMRCLAVVGPSGSGKSSVVRAGIMPALRQGGLPGAEGAYIAEMMPGIHPLDELEAALLRVAAEPLDDLGALLRQDAEGITTAIAQLLPADNSPLFLVVDQFEEVFTLTSSQEERAHFLDLLEHAVTAAERRICLILTLRADFYDRPLLYPGFGELIRQHTAVVLPLNADEQAQAIVGPTEGAGLHIEPALVAAMVADINQQPGMLPLLQYTLTELFEQRESDTLTLAAYRESGGITGALARRADELYARLDAEGQDAARRLFLPLVTLGEGGEDTRRRARWSEITAVAGPQWPAMQQVIDLYSKYRLLTFDHDPQTREPTIEVAHEALIQKWARFRGWLDESREALLVQQRLAAAAAEWASAGRDPAFLATGTRLSTFALLAETGPGAVQPRPEEQAYLQASLALRARRTRQGRLAVAGLGLLAALALLLAVFAFGQQQAAESARATAIIEAQASQARALAASALSSLPMLDRALLLGVAAVQTQNNFEARSSLLTALQRSPHLFTLLYGHSDAVRAVAVSPGGTLAASASADGTLLLWDVAAYRPVGQPLTGHDGWVNAVAFSPDGAYLVSGGDDGTVRLWDAFSGQAVGRPWTGHEGAVRDVAFSPDGQRVASASADGTVMLWAVDAGATPFTLRGHQGVVYTVAFSPDGRLLASGGDDNTARLWDAASGSPLAVLQGHENWVLTLAFSPDGRWLVSSGADAAIILWEAASGQAVIRLDTGHADWVWRLAVSADGRLLGSASADGTVRLWDFSSGDLLDQPLTGHQGAVRGLAFLTEGTGLLSGGDDGRVILWSTATNAHLAAAISGDATPLTQAVFSPDGRWLAVAGGDPLGETDSAIRLWPLTATGAYDPDEAPLLLEGHSGAVTGLAFSPDGQRVASGGGDQSLVLWTLPQGTDEVVTELLITSHGSSLTGVVYSPDGETIFVADEQGGIQRVQIATQQVESFAEHEGGVLALALSPDGALLASAGWDGRVVLWNAVTAAVVQRLNGHSDVVQSVAFSPDATLLASGSRDNTAMLWDVQSGERVGQPLAVHDNWVNGVAFSPDGALLATGSRDGSVQLWDVATQRAYGEGLHGHADWVNGVAFHPNGALLASAGRDGQVILWAVSPDAWVASACAIANRGLAQEERQLYQFPEGVPHCP